VVCLHTWRCPFDGPVSTFLSIASGLLRMSVTNLRTFPSSPFSRMCGIAANTYYLSTYLAYSSPPKMLDNR
jgi:hypothetical protein